jgi:hypothetical protein
MLFKIVGTRNVRERTFRIRTKLHIYGMTFYILRILESLNDCADIKPLTRKERAVWVSLACANRGRPIVLGDMPWSR